MLLRAILHRNLEHWVHKSRHIEAVKQEMARVNIDILGISKPKWTGMGQLNSDTIISTSVVKNPLEEME